MTSVDRLGALLAQLRSSLTEKSRRGEKASRTASSTRVSSAAQARPSGTDIRAGLLSHLAGLDLQIEGDMQRARQLFIELVLVSEFGGRIANDARFIRMAEQVEAAMAADPKISAELSEVLLELAAP